VAIALVAIFVWDRKARKDQREDRQERHKETAGLGASQGQVPGFSPKPLRFYWRDNLENEMASSRADEILKGDVWALASRRFFTQLQLSWR
jgi:hypothetical protein